MGNVFFRIFTKKLKTTLAALLALVLIFLSMPAAFYAAGRFPIRLTLNGEKIGGMPVKQAKERIIFYSSSRNRAHCYFLVNGEKQEFIPEEIGVIVDAEKSAARVRSLFFGNPDLKLCKLWLKAFYLGMEVEPVLEINEKNLTAFLRAINDRFGRPPLNALVTFDEKGNPRYQKEKFGLQVSRSDVVESAKKAILTGKPVELKLKKAEPSIILSDLKQLVDEQAELFKTKKLILSSNNRELVIEGDNLLSLLKSGTVNGKLTFVVDPRILSKVAGSFFKQLEVKPKNASFDVINGEVVIVPEKKGLVVNATETARQATLELYFSQHAHIKPVLMEVEPEITADEAKGFGIKELISSYTTSYNPSQTARVSNIKLLARILDGMLIAPGETFSLNERVGPRTLDRGFLPAPTIIGGRLVDTAGGGACQVGTTLFNAAFFAGLKIVERHNHSFYISHYPAGRDATVSYGGYDLKFRNDYKNWILIKAQATQSRITISLYGTSEARKVQYVTNGPYDFKPYRTEVIEDPTLPLGYRKVEDKGIAGRRYVVIRYVYDSLGRLLHKDSFVSVYRPKNEIVRVGTKKTSESTSSTQAAVN